MNVNRAWWGLECSDDILKLVEEDNGLRSTDNGQGTTDSQWLPAQERDVEEEMMRWY